MTSETTPRTLRHWRQQRALTQQQLAEELIALSWRTRGADARVDAAMVSKWERGQKGVSLRYQRLLAEYFGIDPDQLLPGPNLTVLTGGRDCAADVLATTADGLVVPVAAPIGSPLTVVPELSGERPLDVGDPIDVLDATLGILVHSYPWAPAAGHLDAAIRVREIAEGLAPSSRGAVRRRLMGLASEAALLSGRLAFIDLGSPIEGRGHCIVALEAAREARHPALAATAFGWLSLIPAHQRRYRAATAALHNGLRCGDASGDTWVQAWLESVRGEVLTHTGQPGRALAALVVATRLLQVAEGRTPRWLDIGVSHIAGLQGSALLKAGDAAAARSVLQQALIALPPNLLKHRAMLLADLAAVLRDLGELPQAEATMADAEQILVALPLATLARRRGGWT